MRVAVEIDDGREPVVVPDGLQGGGASQGVAGRGDPAGVQAAGQRVGAVSAVQIRQPGEDEAEVGSPDRGPACRQFLVLVPVAAGDAVAVDVLPRTTPG
ncbi:hypothetical protein [Amycolatopsis alba]|uniref:hypothetical protein n=1 Tax=Amycolatopsis alba TaxID=76020 RepID=UPI0003712255|nr:hypothetical protein [Amycolatopsis alba]